MSKVFDLLLEKSPFKALEDTWHFAKRLETFQLTWKRDQEGLIPVEAGGGPSGA